MRDTERASACPKPTVAMSLLIHRPLQMAVSGRNAPSTALLNETSTVGNAIFHCNIFHCLWQIGQASMWVANLPTAAAQRQIGHPHARHRTSIASKCSTAPLCVASCRSELRSRRCNSACEPASELVIAIAMLFHHPLCVNLRNEQLSHPVFRTQRDPGRRACTQTSPAQAARIHK